MDPAGASSRKPACDNCKARKTKCDRGCPCSSCVAAELDCRISRQSAEKRQRVLISARYDEAMENVDRSLREVSQALQTLLQMNEKPRSSPTDSPVAFAGTPLSDIEAGSEGYRGESSFKAHVQRVSEALRDVASNLDLNMNDLIVSDPWNVTQRIQGGTDTPDTACSLVNTPASSTVQYPELEGRPLPPLGQVLRLLRLAQTEKQRLFIDVPVIDEQQFGELCQKVYFAISDYSISAWSIVNTGLFYLFLNLDERHYSQVGVTVSDVQTHTRLLTVNIEAAIQSLRLCQDPSLEACQALALLTTFCNKSGRSGVAWALIAAASRMCIDLGWHHLPSGNESPELSKERSVFWHVYFMDKGMAFTLGRTPSIHQHDISTAKPSVPKEMAGAPENVYLGFFEYAVIVGDMHMELFSAAAQRIPPQARIENAKTFASRIISVHDELKQNLENKPLEDNLFQAASLLLEIIMHCLVTIAYRIVPCDEPGSNPLQCNAACIDAARQALSAIVRANETFGRRRPEGWVMFLNLLFSLVPLACFVVLAGNTVASSSTEDLALLSASLSAIEPAAGSSVSGGKLVDVCKTFYQLASHATTRQGAGSSGVLSSTPPNATPVADDEAAGDFAGQLDGRVVRKYELVMAPQDWDTIMNEFELGTGAGAMASLVEPYMAFDWDYAGDQTK